MNKIKVLGHIDLDGKATVNDITFTRADRRKSNSFHRFSVPFGITRKAAEKLQMEYGYHPLGYGFYSFDATLSGTTWKCSDSCD